MATLEAIGDENIAGRMLLAYTSGDDKSNQGKTVTLSTHEKKQFIVKKINLLGVNDRREVAGEISHRGYFHLLKECSEGSAINLELLPDEVINKVYELIDRKLRKV